MKIGDIAKIYPGLVTTRKKADIKYRVEKVYKLMTLNAVDEHGTINIEELKSFESIEELKEQYFTTRGDVLVRLNEPFTAIYIDENLENILIPSYFVKLEIENKNFKPEYIAWYINSENAKKDFLRSQAGTLVPSINQGVIRDLDIPEKTMKEQEDISNLYKLYIRELKLLKELISEKEKMFRGLTERFIKQ